MSNKGYGEAYRALYLDLKTRLRPQLLLDCPSLWDSDGAYSHRPCGLTSNVGMIKATMSRASRHTLSGQRISRMKGLAHTSAMRKTLLQGRNFRVSSKGIYVNNSSRHRQRRLPLQEMEMLPCILQPQEEHSRHSLDLLAGNGRFLLFPCHPSSYILVVR